MVGTGGGVSLVFAFFSDSGMRRSGDSGLSHLAAAWISPAALCNKSWRALTSQPREATLQREPEKLSGASSRTRPTYARFRRLHRLETILHRVSVRRQAFRSGTVLT